MKAIWTVEELVEHDGVKDSADGGTWAYDSQYEDPTSLEVMGNDA